MSQTASRVNQTACDVLPDSLRGHRQHDLHIPEQVSGIWAKGAIPHQVWALGKPPGPSGLTQTHGQAWG